MRLARSWTFERRKAALVSIALVGAVFMATVLTIAGLAASGYGTASVAALPAGQPSHPYVDVNNNGTFDAVDAAITAAQVSTRTVRIIKVGDGPATGFSGDIQPTSQTWNATNDSSAAGGTPFNITGLVANQTETVMENPPPPNWTFVGYSDAQLNLLNDCSSVSSYPNTNRTAGVIISPDANDYTVCILNALAPLFSKAFNPDPIAAGGTSTLTFTIDNTATSVAATNLTFSDTLPTGVVIANPSGAAMTCAGGTITAVPGGGTISYSGGTVAASSSCTVSVTVTSGEPGLHDNTSGALTSSLGDSGTANDGLTVNVPPDPGFSKASQTNPIDAGGISTLVFTIDNTASGIPATSVAFTDTLPPPIDIANPPNASTTCTGDAHGARGRGHDLLYGRRGPSRLELHRLRRHHEPDGWHTHKHVGLPQRLLWHHAGDGPGA